MITIDPKEFERVKEELEGILKKDIPAINVVTANFINKCISRVKKTTIEEIVDNYYIDKKPIREALEVRNATPNLLEGEVRNARNRRKDMFTLARFKVEVPSSGPLRVAQSRSEGFVEIKRAFIATRKNQLGNIQVFRRDETKRVKGLKGDNRLIDVERSYSIGGMIGARSLDEHIEERAQDYIDEGFDDVLEKFWSGK